MLPKLHDGALFIADAHYQVGVREELYFLLQKIDNKEITTPQLILMGDIFDLLVGSIDYTVKENQKLIRLINQIAIHTPIYYFEGNHDFDLQRLFPKIEVVPYNKQPLVMHYHDRRVALSHGDLHQGWKYTLYSSLIRHPWILKGLNFIDKKRDNFISKKILSEQKNKKLCKKLNHFYKIIKQKLKNYDIASNRFDVICEGHHHMDEEYQFEGTTFKLFASYACGGRYVFIDFKERIVFNQNI